MTNLTTTEIAKRVTAALLDDERTADYEIDVVDDDGVITLTGAVNDREVREAAEEIAAGQEGVIEVVNDIELKEETPEDEDMPPGARPKLHGRRY